MNPMPLHDTPHDPEAVRVERLTLLAADGYALTSREDPFPSVALEAMADDLKASRAWKAMQQAKEVWRARLPEDQGEWLGWLIGLPQAELIDLLALCGALTVNALPAWQPAQFSVARCFASCSRIVVAPRRGLVVRVTELVRLDVVERDRLRAAQNVDAVDEQADRPLADDVGLPDAGEVVVLRHALAQPSA